MHSEILHVSQLPVGTWDTHPVASPGSVRIIVSSSGVSLLNFLCDSQYRGSLMQSQVWVDCYGRRDCVAFASSRIQKASSIDS